MRSHAEVKTDDIAIAFIDKNNEQVDFNNDNDKREIMGFVIYLRNRQRVKTFFRQFKAAELMEYLADWEDWPPMDAAKTTTIEKLFTK